mgnify:CR=1 FL=1
MNYFEHLNYAFSFAQFKKLPVASRITHLAILHKWNAYRQPSSFSITDRELQSLTGLSSQSAITAAKRQLKNFGLIDFKSQKSGTIYFLPQGDSANFRSSSGAQSVANSSATGSTLTTQKVNVNKNNNVKESVRGEDVRFRL